jgi:hypothetical protein
MIVNDHRKILKNIYKVKRDAIEFIEVPDLQFIVTEGEGTRNVYEMHESAAMWSITRVTNRLKDMTKNKLDYKFKLMPLEIIWMQQQAENLCSWKAMMQIPDIIREEMFETAIHELEKRNRSIKVPVKLEKIQQGFCAQALHVGPYHEIQAIIDKINTYCNQNGYKTLLPHREIYVNAPFCNTPDKLKTIIRIQIEN